jgi:hypothetical protein
VAGFQLALWQGSSLPLVQLFCHIHHSALISCSAHLARQHNHFVDKGSMPQHTLPCRIGLLLLASRTGLVLLLVQVVGTTIFAAACVCGFPGVLPTNYSAGDWIFWDAFFW